MIDGSPMQNTRRDISLPPRTRSNEIGGKILLYYTSITTFQDKKKSRNTKKRLRAFRGADRKKRRFWGRDCVCVLK
jgi:hypothetical protein